MPILNRIMVAGGLLGIALVAVLAAQSPGLFSTLEVDSTTRLRDTLRVDGALTLTLEDQIAKRDIAAAAVGQGSSTPGPAPAPGRGGARSLSRNMRSRRRSPVTRSASWSPIPDGWGISNCGTGTVGVGANSNFARRLKHQSQPRLLLTTFWLMDTAYQHSKYTNMAFAESKGAPSTGVLYREIDHKTWDFS